MERGRTDGRERGERGERDGIKEGDEEMRRGEGIREMDAMVGDGEKDYHTSPNPKKQSFASLF